MPERIRFRFEDPEMIDVPLEPPYVTMEVVTRSDALVEMAAAEMAEQGLRLPPEPEERPFGLMPKTPWSTHVETTGCPVGKGRLIVQALVEPVESVNEATRAWREAMALPLGTVAVVEGKRAVLVGDIGGPRRWQWSDGGWTAIPLGAVEVLGHVDDLAVAEKSDPIEEGARQAIEWLRADYPFGEGPDWREQGCEWIADRLAEHTRQRAVGT